MCVWRRPGCTCPQTFASKGFAGLQVTAAGSYAKATGCTFSSSGKSGVLMSSGGRGDFIECTCLNNGLNGISVQDANSAGTISRCTLSDNKSSGVFVSNGATSTIADCVVNSNGSAGVEVKGEGTVVEVKNTSCKASRYNGFFVYQAANTTLHGCTASGNGLHGIECKGENTRLTVNDFDATENTEGGIYLYQAAAGELTNYRVTNCGKSGLFVKDDKSRLVARNCVIQNVGFNGARAAEGAAMQLISCKFAGSKTANAMLADSAGTRLQAQGCELSGAAKHGLLCEKGALVEMSKCVFSNNTLASIKSTGANSRVMLHTCTVPDAPVTEDNGSVAQAMLELATPGDPTKQPLKEGSTLTLFSGVLQDLADAIASHTDVTTFDLGNKEWRGTLSAADGVLKLGRAGLVLRGGAIHFTGTQSVGVAASGCAIREVRFSCDAQEGKEDTTKALVAVRGAGSSLELIKCAVTCLAPKVGVLVAGGAKLTASGCDVTAPKSDGVRVTNAGTSASLSDCKVHDCDLNVNISDAAQAELTDCEVRR